jgi:hypothetical protein
MVLAPNADAYIAVQALKVVWCSQVYIPFLVAK